MNQMWSEGFVNWMICYIDRKSNDEVFENSAFAKKSRLHRNYSKVSNRTGDGRIKVAIKTKTDGEHKQYLLTLTRGKPSRRVLVRAHERASDRLLDFAEIVFSRWQDLKAVAETVVKDLRGRFRLDPDLITKVHAQR